ncbi:MAG: alpha/beta fold hydrolase [Planctomycetales bacterium]|nr:alpha/beta fold hydrolase [Planctomycetales bacterium]
MNERILRCLGHVSPPFFGAGAQAARWRGVVALLVLCSAAVACAADDKEEKEGPPDPEDVALTTKDGVSLRATYWEPEEPGKSTVPVILVHGWEGNRQEYDLLGRQLQSLGHAVISVDLRGHGGSMVRKTPNREEDETLNPARFGRNDFLAMAADVQAAKTFLMGKHKEEKLNIELLTVVGADLGAVVAVNFAYYDWSRQVLPNRLHKLGQDVRGLVLLSPPQSFKGLSINSIMQHPALKSQVSTMIIVGKNDRAHYADAKRLYSSLVKFHVKVDDDATAEEKADKKDLFFQEVDTELAGTKLLHPALRVDAMIREFIRLRAANKADDWPWHDRAL